MIMHRMNAYIKHDTASLFIQWDFLLWKWSIILFSFRLTGQFFRRRTRFKFDWEWSCVYVLSAARHPEQHGIKSYRGMKGRIDNPFQKPEYRRRWETGHMNRTPLYLNNSCFYFTVKIIMGITNKPKCASTNIQEIVENNLREDVHGVKAVCCTETVNICKRFDGNKWTCIVSSFKLVDLLGWLQPCQKRKRKKKKKGKVGLRLWKPTVHDIGWCNLKFRLTHSCVQCSTFQARTRECQFHQRFMRSQTTAWRLNGNHR